MRPRAARIWYSGYNGYQGFEMLRSVIRSNRSFPGGFLHTKTCVNIHGIIVKIYPLNVQWVLLDP